MMRGDWGMLGGPSVISPSDQRHCLSRPPEKPPCMSAGAFSASAGASSCERGAFILDRAGAGQPTASSSWAVPRVHLCIDVQVGVLRRRGSAGGPHTRPQERGPTVRAAALQRRAQLPPAAPVRGAGAGHEHGDLGGRAGPQRGRRGQTRAQVPRRHGPAGAGRPSLDRPACHWHASSVKGVAGSCGGRVASQHATLHGRPACRAVERSAYPPHSHPSLNTACHEAWALEQHAAAPGAHCISELLVACATPLPASGPSAGPNARQRFSPPSASHGSDRSRSSDQAGSTSAPRSGQGRAAVMAARCGAQQNGLGRGSRACRRTAAPAPAGPGRPASPCVSVRTSRRSAGGAARSPGAVACAAGCATSSAPGRSSLPQCERCTYCRSASLPAASRPCAAGPAARHAGASCFRPGPREPGALCPLRAGSEAALLPPSEGGRSRAQHLGHSESARRPRRLRRARRRPRRPPQSRAQAHRGQCPCSQSPLWAAALAAVCTAESGGRGRNAAVRSARQGAPCSCTPRDTRAYGYTLQVKCTSWCLT